MTDTPPPNYSLKKLRDLCENIYDEQMAFLLMATLPEFPIEIVNKVFSSAKLNEPSSDAGREWADIVRLAFIAFAPEGSEPATLRGKAIPRFRSGDYRSFSVNEKSFTDEPGSLTLHPVAHPSPLLRDIAIALGVNSLVIKCDRWLARYHSNPFPLRELISQPDYSLGYLRDLCQNIYDEQKAFRLMAILPEAPVEIVNSFFTSAKLNEPSNDAGREWADIVRLAFIAFAPDGSEPAKLRGKAIPRFRSGIRYIEDASFTDEPRSLTLYPVARASTLLKDIAIVLRVDTLLIKCPLWRSTYLCNPFPLRKLISCSGGDLDDGEIFELLPAELEELDLSGSSVSGAGINRLKSLRNLSLTVDSLPEGIDFSSNKALKSLDLCVRSEGSSPIKGLGGLPSLESLDIDAKMPLESLDGLFARSFARMSLERVRYSVETVEGFLPEVLLLSNVSGLRKVSLVSEVSSAASDRITVRIESSSLDSLEISGANKFEVSDCPALESVTARLMKFDTDYDVRIIANCPVLRSIAISLEAWKVGKIEFVNLPVLQDFKLDAVGADVKIGKSIEFVGCGMSRMPDFGGKWEGVRRLILIQNWALQSLTGVEKLQGLQVLGLVDNRALQTLSGIEKLQGLQVLDLVGNRALQNLSGIEKLQGLKALYVRSTMGKEDWQRKLRPIIKHESLVAIFPGDTISPLSSVTSLIIEDAPLDSLRGLEAFPNLTSIVIRSASLKSLEGLEQSSLLQEADLTGCSSIRSLAPIAGLGNLVWLKVSGCDRIKPKPPHTVMEGTALEDELSRLAAPGQRVSKKSNDLAKLGELIGDGSRSDVSQALQLLHALGPEDSETLLRGAAIDPKTGWIRLPFLGGIDEEKVRGIVQLKIVQAIGGDAAAALLGSVKSVKINSSDAPNSVSTLCFGKYGSENEILDEFPSLGSLPDFPNLEEIEIHSVSRFSLEGAEKFSRIRKLCLGRVSQIESLASLGCFSALEELIVDERPPSRSTVSDGSHWAWVSRLTGKRFLPDPAHGRDLTGFGTFPLLKQLTVSIGALSSLEGLENFPSLEMLSIDTAVVDISALIDYAARRGCRIAYMSTIAREDDEDEDAAGFGAFLLINPPAPA